MAKLINLKTLLFLGFIILFLISYPILIQEVNYQVKKFSPQDYRLVESYPLEAERIEEEALMFSRQKVVIPESYDFSLLIPEIDINSQVFSNVDINDENEYLAVFKKGLAHVQGSSLPDEKGIIFIFSHTGDNLLNIISYNTEFFLLKKLEPGDDIYVFYAKKKYNYQVTEKKIIEPQDIEKEIKDLKGDFLVLQTCYPSGISLQRLIVIAKKLD